MNNTFSNFKRQFYGNEVICAMRYAPVSIQTPKRVI